MTGVRVAVTRPEPDGRRTAARLEALGHEAILAPVLRIEPTGEPLPEGRFDAVAVTSANAVPPLAAVRDRLRGVPLLAVGPRTAAALAEAGLGRAEASAGDGAALAALLAARYPGVRTVLHPGGAERKPEPAASLSALGVAVTAWTVYRAVPTEALPAALERALAHGEVDAMLHYSRRSAEILVRLADAAGLAGALARPAHACLSRDAAEPLLALGLPRIMAAAEPSERSLLEALPRLAPDAPCGPPGVG